MKGVEEVECTAVVVILKFIRNLVACSMNHYPGVSHRTFGFGTLSNDLRHDFDTLTPPFNQIEQTKNIRIEKKQMFSLNVSRKSSRTTLECFIFERVRLRSPGHRTKWNSLQKNTSGTKSSSWSSVETPKAIWSFVSFLQWSLYVTALY